VGLSRCTSSFEDLGETTSATAQCTIGGYATSELVGGTAWACTDARRVGGYAETDLARLRGMNSACAEAVAETMQAG